MSDQQSSLRNKLVGKPTPLRVGLAGMAVLILGLVYLFQRVNFLEAMCNTLGVSPMQVHPYWFFVVNKTLRLMLNDLACFMLIFSIFQEGKYLRIAWYLFLFEILVLLPFYFALKLGLEGDSEISSPLLSQIHRMIVNPTLMILLMIGFFYQRLKERAR